MSGNDWMGEGVVEIGEMVVLFIGFVGSMLRTRFGYIPMNNFTLFISLWKGKGRGLSTGDEYLKY